jgi:hypothetical protein
MSSATVFGGDTEALVGAAEPAVDFRHGPL